MPLLEWSPGLDVGVTDFNQQHQRLIGMVNELHTAMMEGKGSRVIGDVLKEMRDYTAYHFGSEEKLMTEKGYPALQTHRAEHQAFVAKVDDLTSRYQQGSLSLSVETLNFLKDWLVHHIQGTDKAYKDFFAKAGVR